MELSIRQRLTLGSTGEAVDSAAAALRDPEVEPQEGMGGV